MKPPANVGPAGTRAIHAQGFILLLVWAALALPVSAAQFELQTRHRERDPEDTNTWRVVERAVDWDAARTAFVVCDMWDRHWCQGATRRVAEMAPRMNEILKAARAKGALVIHCPSDTMDFYRDTPQRRLAMEAPKAPERPQGWKSLDPNREPPLPIDDSDGGCDDSPQCRQHRAWSRQIPVLEILPGDAITDSDEAFNLMKARGITNVVVMGVHLNMCVLGRPFSIRNMVSLGQNVVFVRDMTDTMYNSRMPPFVSHFAGTDLVIEHIEKYWCPSVTSVSFLGGEPFRFRDDRRPRVTFLIGEDEYRTWETLPAFAEKELRWRGLDVRIVQEENGAFPELIPAVGESDLLVVSVRRRPLEPAQLDAIRAHLAAGRPLVGIRTASHAFAPRGEDVEPERTWPEFDGEVLGGSYHGHHGSGPVAEISLAPDAASHPVLQGVSAFASKGSLYRVRPLAPDAVPLLIGSIPDREPEPVAWVRSHGERQARIFYTSLGHPADFDQPGFRRLLLNGILWALDRPIPPAPRDSEAATASYRDGWSVMPVPGTWDEHSGGALGAFDGVAWYRCMVRPPANWSGAAWELHVEQVDNAHEAYFDGQLIGAAGAFPPNYVNGLGQRGVYPVPEGLARAGDWHLVALRVYDHDGRGGFKGRAPILRAGDQAIALAGEWQFRIGDDPGWSTGTEGELGNALFHEVSAWADLERTGRAARAATTPRPMSPEESARSFQLMEGLEMELLLAEPEIAQPLHISFDERGRLWLVEYRQYPAPAGLTLVSHDQFWRAVYDKVPPPPPDHFRGKDRITIHEDTDGDGAFDRHRVFVDGLNIATAVAKGRGGVWVLNPPYLLFYPDANNDDVPDGDPEVHLEGFGLEDTHSVVNSLRWGPDGWLYAAQGSTVSARVRRPGTDAAPVHTLGQNIWRYHPEQRRYEVFAEGGGNAFGVEIDDAGRIFSGHNGGNTRGFHYVQGGYLRKGFEKHGELSNPYAFGYFPEMAHPDVERFTHTFVIEGGGIFSEPFRGRLFGIEPMQGRVVLSEITREGSTFRTRDLGYAVVSRDPWFKPVDIKQGPDGALYIADWYDAQVNHWRNYQGNMDASNGRVYRLKPTGSAPVRAEDLGSVPVERLVALLEHPNRWVRQVALRLIGDRRDDRVADMVRPRIASARGQAALEYLWALHLSRGLDAETARQTLEHPEPSVREWTVRLLGDQNRIPQETFPRVLELATSETNADVRLQLAATARRLPSEQALKLIRRLLDRDEDASDPRQPLMVWWALEAHAAHARAGVLALLDERALWDKPLVRDHLLERCMRRYAAAGQPEDLDTCLALLQAAPTDAARRVLVAGFEKGFRDHSLAGLPPALLAELGRAGQGSLVLQLRLGADGALERAVETIRDESAPSALRAAVIQALGELKPSAALEGLLQAARSENEAVRVAAVAALRAFDHPEIGARIAEGLADATDSTRTAALLLLASRASWARELIAQVKSGALPPAAVPAQVLLQIRRHDDEALNAAVEEWWPARGGGEFSSQDHEIRRIEEILRTGTGDPYNGKKLYAASCGACHRLFNDGGDLGPDLTPFRRSDVQAMLLSIVSPSVEIREGYENYLVETRDDRSLSGFIVRRDDRVVVLRGLDGQDVVLQREEIAELRPAGISLMPEGLLHGWSDEQLRDLFAYLRSSQPLAN